MTSGASRVLYVLSALVFAGCGRIGVDYVPHASPKAGTSAVERDASMPDAATPEPTDAASEAGSDANAPDASAPDAESPDADSPDASAPQDAGATDASVADCRLTVSGTDVAYRIGELAMLQGTHMLTLVGTGLCAAPAGCTLNHGSDVAQASCAISRCQMWESIDAGGGWLSLRNANSGACLYIPDTADGTSAITWECAVSNKTRWHVACAGGDTWYLISEHSGKPLAGDGTTAPGAGIVQSGQTPSTAHRFRITSNPAAFDVVMRNAETDASSTWRYTTTAPAPSWSQSSYDDSGWSMGPGAFGDTARGFTAARTSWTSSDIWLRRSFVLSRIPATLTANVFHDENVEIYVNGVSAATLSGWSQGYRAVDLPSAVMSALVVGTNTIAVHCRNTSAPQFIDVGLVTYTWQ